MIAAILAGGLALCWLLAVVVPASAEAWALWAFDRGLAIRMLQMNVPDEIYRTSNWQRVSSHPTRQECEDMAARRSALMKDIKYDDGRPILLDHSCWPDTVDPRGPKGTK